MSKSKEEKKLVTFADFRHWLNENGVTKLPLKISLREAVEIIKGLDVAKKKYKKLMDYQTKNHE